MDVAWACILGATVASFAALPGCDATNMGETRRVSNIGGVFVCSGIRWDAALNESNDFALPQHLHVTGNANISGSAAIAGNVSVNGWAAIQNGATISGHTTLAGNAQVNGAANLYGTTTTHGALNANAGMNVGAGQTIYNPGTMHVEANNDLHLKPWTGGNVVIGGGGGSGNLYARGRVTANGSHAITAQSNDWSMIARDAAGGLNNAPGNSAGSLHINDAYVRSTGKWLSQSGGVTTRIASQSFYAHRWPGGVVSCNWDEKVVGGGGSCVSGIGWMFVAASAPSGNGWYVGCDTERSINAWAHVYAICAK